MSELANEKPEQNEADIVEPAESSADASSDSTATDATPPPPPASFEMLVSMLFSQAMAMLGHFPDPQTGKTTTNKPYAKYTIDTLDLLSQKTAGNLSEDESKMLSQTLHSLRMAYIEVKEK
ncbi:DUF1844 domain-containing protein [Rubripirellula sp.]|jgi:hypothetical protein|nr:DUF1844 domain-containing protein [Rubripirellula sp.]